MKPPSLSGLRAEIDGIDREILRLLRSRGECVEKIGRLKRSSGIAAFDPSREDAMIRDLLGRPTSPLGAHHVRNVFTAIFRASLDLQNRQQAIPDPTTPGTVAPVTVRDVVVGGARPTLFFGPCAVESAAQIAEVAAFGPKLPGRAVLRGGTFKPRTRHESFQGLREEGVELLHRAGADHDLPTVTEVLDVTSLGSVVEKIDMIQIGTRNMYNTELLKAAGRTGRPILLKRGFMATIDEYLGAVDYIRAEGNHSIVLCERGIRSFDYRTRNTLDLASVPLLQAETGLPVIVDVSHALGRTDLILPCTRAALAIGANGLMIEVHPDPANAFSDNDQQIDLGEFEELLETLGLVGDEAGAPETSRLAAGSGDGDDA